MRGVIRIREVLSHLPLVLREFGPRCLARCLFAWASGKSTTFLEAAFRK